MSINIGAPGPDFSNQLNASNSADIASVVFNIHKKDVKIRKSKVKDITKGLAEIAYSMGETNDVDAFNEEMADTIMKAFKKIEDEERK